MIVKLSREGSCERESVDVLKLEDFMFLSLLGFQVASSLTSPKKIVGNPSRKASFFWWIFRFECFLSWMDTPHLALRFSLARCWDLKMRTIDIFWQSPITIGSNKIDLIHVTHLPKWLCQQFHLTARLRRSWARRSHRNPFCGHGSWICFQKKHTKRCTQDVLTIYLNKNTSNKDQQRISQSEQRGAFMCRLGMKSLWPDTWHKDQRWTLPSKEPGMSAGPSKSSRSTGNLDGKEAFLATGSTWSCQSWSSERESVMKFSSHHDLL